VGGEIGENPRPATARSSLHGSAPTEASELTLAGPVSALPGNRTDMANAGQTNLRAETLVQRGSAEVTGEAEGGARRALEAPLDQRRLGSPAGLGPAGHVHS
jgi:hypothetical protein